VLLNQLVLEQFFHIAAVLVGGTRHVACANCAVEHSSCLVLSDVSEKFPCILTFFVVVLCGRDEVDTGPYWILIVFM